nr:hypothetical protein [Demequina litorisediminis]
MTADDAEAAERVFELLMGNDVGPRRDFIIAGAARSTSHRSTRKARVARLRANLGEWATPHTLTATPDCLTWGRPAPAHASCSTRMWTRSWRARMSPHSPR